MHSHFEIDAQRSSFLQRIIDPQPTKKVIYIGEYEYDITNFKHPGGNVIDYMTSGQDATQVFEEFHYRSNRAKLILHSLPHKKRENPDTLTEMDTETNMLVDFARFRKSLEDRGFFTPSYSHITYRIMELIAIYSFAIYTMQYSIAASIILLGLFSGRCGWVQHEGGHNSFTGNIKTDKIVQNVFIGFGLLADGSMWNSMHNKHHATTQKIGHDMDLDTAPFVLFYPSDLDVKKQMIERLYISKGEECTHTTFSLRTDAQHCVVSPALRISAYLSPIPTLSLPLCATTDASLTPRSGIDPIVQKEPVLKTPETNFLDKAARIWLKYQAYTFLPVTSGIFVTLFWLLYLHPRKIIRDKNVTQALIVSVGHLSRLGLFMKIGNMTIYGALWCHFVTLWVSGMYLFGQFSLSHTFMPVVESIENPNWVRYAVDHTVDIEPQNKMVGWIMGYLNNQVIHHLFPAMPQYRGPEVSKEFAVFCKKWDLKYTVITYREAWYYMFANLNTVGHDLHK